jgi:hypothetical protein
MCLIGIHIDAGIKYNLWQFKRPHGLQTRLFYMEINKDIEEFEKCFICGISLPKGIGKFRKVEKVYCIKCFQRSFFHVESH